MTFLHYVWPIGPSVTYLLNDFEFKKILCFCRTKTGKAFFSITEEISGNQSKFLLLFGIDQVSFI